MTTTYQAFEQFLTDISITEYQKTSRVAARKDSVVENLTEAFPSTSDLPFADARLMGSAAKGTIIRPIDDIDVLAVFSNEKRAWQNKYQFDSRAFLYRIREAYNGLVTAQVGARGQAIRIFFSTGGHVDVAPVFKQSDDVFHLPDGTGGWLYTSPFVANKWFLDTNSALEYHLAPLVRILKVWNINHSRRLRSFHLETMAGETFSTLGSNKRSALRSFFEWAPNHIDVTDPGGKSGLLSSYLNWSAREAVLQSFAAAHDRANRAISAEDRGDHSEAKRLWALILGPKFPTT
ncbi:SMODS domain-containing nucleotidyltransferase [Mycobacteroides abscessus]